MTGLFRRPSKQPRLAGMLGFGEARAVPEQAKEIGGAGGSEERQRRGQEEGASTGEWRQVQGGREGR